MKFIALGSNLSSPIGGRILNLRRAIQHLQECGFQILARAPVYQSSPVPISDQPDFLNTVVQVEFSGTPQQAIEICHRIESDMGRVRVSRNEARVIDLDIIAWGDVVMSGDLEIPHPRMHERAFVLFPLVHIMRHWRHPIVGKTAEELALALPPSDIHQTSESL